MALIGSMGLPKFQHLLNAARTGERGAGSAVPMRFRLRPIINSGLGSLPGECRGECSNPHEKQGAGGETFHAARRFSFTPGRIILACARNG